MAMKAAVVAGRRKVRNSRRVSRSDRQRDMSRLAALPSTRARVVREVRRDLAEMSHFPFRTSEALQQGKTVVGEAARMVGMKSNRRYKPGD